MALSTSIVDLLLLGDNDIDRLIPGTINFAADLDSDARTRKEQAALYFFMLSHFVADACMPCHCDGRDLADYSKGLHNKLEKHWSRKVGGTSDDKYLMHTNMTSNKILKEARKIDTEFNITFKNSNHVPRIKSKDLWLEIINCCRAAFALNSIIAHPDDYPYDVPDLRAPFAVVFAEDHDA
jgi:Zn-finger protein